MSTTQLARVLGLLTLLSSIASGQLVSTWTGGGLNQNWGDNLNWSTPAIPCNGGGFTYDAILGGASGIVSANVICTVDGLTIDAPAELSLANGITLGVDDFLTNNGDITMAATTSLTTLSLTGAVDGTVEVTGSGRIVLDNSRDRVGGSATVVMDHGAAHRIEGFGRVGLNLLEFINRGTIIANNPLGLLEIDPRNTFTNEGGSLIATNGATLVLLPGSYTDNGGTMRVDDDAVLRLAAATLTGGTFAVDNTDGDLSNNRVEVSATSVLTGGMVNEATLALSNAIALTLLNDDFTNNGDIFLESTTTNTSLFVNDTIDQSLELKGSGRILLDSSRDLIQGSANHELVHGAAHLIEGGGQIGVNLIDVVNRGLVEGNDAGVNLVIDPRNDWVNDGGTVEAKDGAIVQLNAAEYSSANGGTFRVGDGSEMRILAGTVFDTNLDVDDVDLDISNNIYRITGTSVFRDVVNKSRLLVNNAVTLSIVDGDLVNDELIELESTTTNTSIFVTDNGDQVVRLGGTGAVLLDSARDRVVGSAGHTLEQDVDHSIRGFGTVGANLIDFVNKGVINSNVAGESMTIDPRTTFHNDGGRLLATNGGKVVLQGAAYTVDNGGLYTIADDSFFDLAAVTMTGLTLAVENLDATIDNNRVTITGTSGFTDVVNEASLHVNNAVSLTVADGDFTNNGEVHLDSITTNTSLFVRDSVDQAVTIGGTGTVFLDHSTRDRVVGSTGHLLVNGPLHTFEGAGNIGANLIDIENGGFIHANRTGETLTIDPRTSFLNDGGRLHASNGATVALQGAFYDSNGGEYKIFDTAAFTLTTVTLRGLTLEVDDQDASLDNNTATLVGTSSFTDVVNEAKVVVGNALTLTILDSDLVNNGIIDLASITSTSNLAISDSVDQRATLGGTGRLLLDNSLRDRVGGATNHTLVHGPAHTIEGTGRIGNTVINFENEGTVSANVAGQALIVDVRIAPVKNRGTLEARNGAILDVNDSLAQGAGLFFIETGSTGDLQFDYTQTDGVARIDGELTATAVAVNGGLLEGTGTINGPVSATGGTVGPGNSVGTLTVDGDVAFNKSSALSIEVASAASADLLTVIDNVTINLGTLKLSYSGGPGDVGPLDEITIMTANSGLDTQRFANASDGVRLNTTDGRASFVVRYPGSSVVLSDFLFNSPPVPGGPPVFSGPTSFDVSEHAPIGTVVGEMTAIDPEGCLVTYDLTSGVPFAIDPVSGVITTTGALDFELQMAYNLTVTATDPADVANQPITINLINVLENNQEVVTDVLTGPGGPYPGESDPGIIGIGADPDFDGDSNIMEVWRGSDPSDPTSQPRGGLLKLVNNGGMDFGACEVDVVSAMDDLLAIVTEISFDLVTWRDISATRVVLSDVAGVRRLEFTDTVPLPVPLQNFFVRFGADPNASP